MMGDIRIINKVEALGTGKLQNLGSAPVLLLAGCMGPFSPSHSLGSAFSPPWLHQDPSEIKRETGEGVLSSPKTPPKAVGLTSPYPTTEITESLDNQLKLSDFLMS